MCGQGANALSVSSMEAVNGGEGADAISVAGGIATRLSGNDGNDIVVSGSGSDQIGGGSGADQLTGGAGVDPFIDGGVTEASTMAGGAITDFSATTDLSIFTGMLTSAFSFLGGAGLTATGSSQARLDATPKILLIDTGGDGNADIKITLTGADIAGLDTNAFLWR